VKKLTSYAAGDENGLFPNQTTDDLPPAAVLDAQEQEERFVKVWVNGKSIQVLCGRGRVLTISRVQLSVSGKGSLLAVSGVTARERRYQH
jgi:hypothetical protein